MLVPGQTDFRSQISIPLKSSGKIGHYRMLSKKLYCLEIHMKGSCLCGTVEYEIIQLDSPIAHCACRTCRKAHAAAFNSSAAVNRDHFRWSKGQENLKYYESSPCKRRYFCGTCGSHLVAERIGQPNLILRVATLDDDPGGKPVCRIWQSHEVPWLENGYQIPSFPEWQPGH